MGTMVENLQVTKVIDGDTIKVLIVDKEETLRLICVNPEESQPGGSKPVTKAGKAATKMAKEYLEPVRKLMNRLQKRESGSNCRKFSANRPAIHLKFATICPRSHTFSLRSPSFQTGS